MIRLLVRRVVLAFPLLLCVTLGVFVLVSLMPGDPARLLAGSNPQLVPYIRHSLGLNKPLPLRYWHWLYQALHGDLGDSWIAAASGQKQTVVSVLWQRAPVTISLTLFALFVTTIVAWPLGTLAALFQGRLVDRIFLAAGSFTLSLPTFWLGYIFILWFAVRLHWLPPFGYEPLSAGFASWLSHICLPGVILALSTLVQVAFQLRGALIEVLEEGYIRAAWAKGLSPSKVIAKHALKNAAAPVTTILGFQLAQLLGGAVITETVFNLPGLGSLAVTATLDRDVPVILGLLVVTTAVVLVTNALMELMYGYLNPRGRLRGA